MKRIGAIDVGTSKICAIIADADSGASPRILGVGITPSHGLQKGMVVNIDEAKRSIQGAIRQAEQTAGYKMDKACVGVTGKHINSANRHGVVAVTRNNNVVRSEDMQRVLEVARDINLTPDEQLLHIIPRSYTVDGQDGVKNPVGMHGFRLDVETHVVSASTASLQNLVKCIRSIGVDVDGLVLEPLASAEAILGPEEKNNGVIMADIGGGTTDVAIFKENSICHSSVIPVAGYQVTHDISVGLGISFDMAEELKIKCGDTEAVDEEKGKDKTISYDGHNISIRQLSSIIRARYEELLRLIMLEIPETEYFSSLPAGLVLTGGAASVPGLIEIAPDIVHMPVRLGVPLDLTGISDTLVNPAYATSVGLLLWKMNRGATDGRVPSLGGVRSFFSSIFGRSAVEAGKE